MRFYFNPRTREGCDANLKDTKIDGTLISIHAPVKGATVVSTAFCDIGINFNPRTREGCDQNSSRTIRWLSIFQSTHP